MLNSQSCYREYSTPHHYSNDDWEHGEYGGTDRGAANDIGTDPLRPKQAVVNRRDYYPLDDDDGTNFCNESDGFPEESQESNHHEKYSHHDEGESVGENTDTFEEYCHDNEESTNFARRKDSTVAQYPYYNALRDSQDRHRLEIHSHDARGDDESSKEYYDENINTNNICHGIADRQGRVKGAGRINFRDQCGDDICSHSDEDEIALSHRVRVNKNTARRSPLQNRNHKEIKDEESYLENDEGNFYENDDYFHRHGNINVDDRTEWSGRIDFNQIQHPQSMLFDQEEGCYEADDEYQHLEQGALIEEISFLSEQEGDVENDNVHSFESAPRDDNQYNEDPSMEDGVSGTNGVEHQNSIKPSSEQMLYSSESLEVIRRIESVMEGLFKFLDRKEEPILRGYVNRESFDEEEASDDQDDEAEAFVDIAKTSGDPNFYRKFGYIAQSRSFTSICLVMSFIHQLLLSNRTTTTREVYYVFVTHFRNQRECDDVILDVAKILGVSRRSLGLSASPKGWFCGCVEITRKGALPSGKDVSGSIDGTALPSIQGLPITREWTERDEFGCTEDGVEIKVSSKNAKVILVIEKEGVYNRLSEERIFDRIPCILVTGKGFPDLATRALVNTLHRELKLPVIGLCDCNPYGISVLAVYHCAGDRMGIDGRMRYSVPIQWLGLRPSEVARLKDDMPATVFQKLTDLDNKRITSLLDPENAFLAEEDEDEVRKMEEAGYKVELEALYWLGPDYMGNWVVEMLKDAHERMFVK